MNNIRNFCILAHIDHGKSTLADRLLELTGTVPKSKMREQYLDMMELERERGITIKLQPVRMTYMLNAIPYTLNLIDTPGHVDFSYEVSRALAAVEGAVLLIDATKGVQAQTLANLELAQKQGLVIIPAVNKIDMPNAAVEATTDEMAELLGIGAEEIIKISAKEGINIQAILDAIVAKVPPPASVLRTTAGKPEENINLPFRALIFDSQYDAYKGAVAYVRVVDGQLRTEEDIYLMAAKTGGAAKEVGYFAPELTLKEKLGVGEIGYIATGIKEPGKVRVGDTIISAKAQISSVKSLPGYKEPRPMVFASFYLENVDQHDELRDALSRLQLNDPSFTFEPESREGLGRGFKCGFLGTLHLEIISERVRREFGIAVVVSAPSVTYKFLKAGGHETLIYSASDWPEGPETKTLEELWIRLELIAPRDLMGKVTDLLNEFAGVYKETRTLRDKIIIVYEMALREFIRDFYGRLKSATKGYGSLSYEVSGWRSADLVKLEILVAGSKEEAFSQIVAANEAYGRGRSLVERLKDILPAQQFAVALQAVVGGKVIARETMRAKGKDVIAPLYGGDYTRKRKLLEKQKKGKKELKAKGRVRIPQEVFVEMIKK